MPISRFNTDIDDLIAEFRKDSPRAAHIFDDLRMAVVRMNEIQRQLDIARRKLAPVISIAEMEIVHRHVDFSAGKPCRGDRFRLAATCLTGVPEIDDERRELFSLGNRLYLLSQDESATAKEIATVFGELIAQAREHFAAEEALMEEVDFPDRDGHRAVHERMIDYLVEAADLISASPFIVAIKLEKFLGSWLVWHMEREDAALAECVALNACEVI